ncbi:DUF1566 domain-containing protein, partial [candidate division KSB1 bacterium]|nr:DUF1566 domain-containing protein [candidate division KSB1 bacterium]
SMLYRAKKNNFFDADEEDGNKTGGGIPHKFITLENGNIVYDEFTELYWDLTSSEKMEFMQAQEYIANLNAKMHGGYSDWRMPSLEELMSLMEPGIPHINPVFGEPNSKWSRDRSSFSSVWTVAFVEGKSYNISDIIIDKDQLMAVRGKPAILSESQLGKILKESDFFCKNTEWNASYANPNGAGVNNAYELSQDGKTIFDRTTGFYWTQTLSNSMNYEEALQYIQDLNTDKFGQFNNWRLPSLKEIMTIIEPEEQGNGMHINPIFNLNNQKFVNTRERYSIGVTWCVNLNGGFLVRCPYRFYSGVLAVRDESR